ncbi:MAG: PD40 domain-containing protein [Acidobacteriota bacterium]|nr:MAG: PD40 domain-containing protein [Acidobacteriota bacterium]
MMLPHGVLLFAALLFIAALQAQNPAWVSKELRGPYLGQKPPGTQPEIFAPGIVSTDFYNHSSLTISPDGREIYWAMGPLDQPIRIYVSKWLAEGWTKPEIVSFTKDYNGDCPVLSPDGRSMYFNSDRPHEPGRIHARALLGR